MTLLGLDIGEVRTGVAISNEVSSICSPLDFIKSNENLIQKISEIIDEHSIDTIIIGLPMLMNGREGERAKYSRKIKKQLENRYELLKIVLWDERLTTKQAEKYLKEMTNDRKKIKDNIDSLSAVLILENYIVTRKKS
ncbi:MAG: Holliday junction resolvase RuvX [Chloroflexi bacterium]|nr:Holliday junction resolvase RuvX [Chloroflexota bacterium]|tara:strand:- start:3912 stop:4325 length:414 start_codon:yes stop_codon:yes gene_type:complete